MDFETVTVWVCVAVAILFTVFTLIFTALVVFDGVTAENIAGVLVSCFMALCATVVGAYVEKQRAV